MKMKTLHNPSTSDIIDYPVSEAEVDAAGNIVYNRDGKMMVTNRTNLWTIKAGETIKFPEYVADYLLTIYEFLEPVSIEVETVETKGGDACPKCGKVFEGKGPRAKALHYAAKHPELLP